MIVALPGLFSYLCFDVVKTIYALKIVQQFWIFKTFGWTDGWIFEVMTVGSNKHIHTVKKAEVSKFRLASSASCGKVVLISDPYEIHAKLTISGMRYMLRQ